MEKIEENIIIRYRSSGSAVDDLQRKLSNLGYLKDSQVDGFFGDDTLHALREFCRDEKLGSADHVTEKVWAKLVDASFKLGDRNLYLTMPYFHGADVLQLQKALVSLGFAIDQYDGIFGATTETALRKFQINMGLPCDGIAGSHTFATLNNLKFVWNNKDASSNNLDINFTKNNLWRASEVLENNLICVYGTNEFTRDVAKRISKIALATNPFSNLADSAVYSVVPDPKTLLIHIVLPDDDTSKESKAPRCAYEDKLSSALTTKNQDLNDDQNRFVKRLTLSIPVAKNSTPHRLIIELPSKTWWDAGEDRSAQHFAIMILDALCEALSIYKKQA